MAARGTRPKVGAPNYKHIGDKHLLNKKVPMNPQYANVQTKLDTGARWRDDVTFIRPKRKNEFFGRLSADLMVQILDENEDDEESLYNLASEGVVGRVAEHSAGATVGAGGAMPYLLLDMRDGDAFDEFHIRSANHFPAAMLSVRLPTPSHPALSLCCREQRLSGSVGRVAARRGPLEASC